MGDDVDAADGGVGDERLQRLDEAVARPERALAIIGVIEELAAGRPGEQRGPALEFQRMGELAGAARGGLEGLVEAVDVEQDVAPVHGVREGSWRVPRGLTRNPEHGPVTAYRRGNTTRDAAPGRRQPRLGKGERAAIRVEERRGVAGRPARRHDEQARVLAERRGIGALGFGKRRYARLALRAGGEAERQERSEGQRTA